MTTPLSLTARKAELTGLRNGLDAGGGKALFYTGIPPALPDSATAETLLGTIALAATSGVVGASGALATLTLAVPQVASAIVQGDIGFVRLVNGAGDGFMDLPVGVAGSGMPVIVNATQVYTGGELQFVSCVIAK
jgi:hypothetical protein